MIPVPDSTLEVIDLSDEIWDIDPNDKKYKDLLLDQYAFIQSKEKSILNKARKIYEIALKEESNLNGFELKIKARSCNLVLLIEKCKQYK